MSVFINTALSLLPQEIATKALQNHADYCKSDFGIKCRVAWSQVGSISQALTEGFIWKETPEGFTFWHDIYKGQVVLEETAAKFRNQQILDQIKNGHF